MLRFRSNTIISGFTKITWEVVENHAREIKGVTLLGLADGAGIAV